MIASPKGGEAPLDPGSMEAVKNDAISSAFAKEQKGLWSNTKKLADLNPNDYDAIFYVGGHGREWARANFTAGILHLQ